MKTTGSSGKLRTRLGMLIAGVMVAATTQATLVGHWKFDETSGNEAMDSSGNEFHGVISGTPVWADGVDSGALYFDGVNVGVQNFAGDVLGTVSNELTIAFWCFGDAGKKVQQNAFSTSSRELHAHFPWDGPTIYYDAGATGRDRLQFGVSDDSLLWGKWNHWVFTKNVTAGTMAVYVNGSATPLASATGKTVTLDGLPTSFFIGSDKGSGLYYKGLMDDFRVYDHELSTTEISDLYSSVEFDFVLAAATATPDAGGPPLEVAFDGSDSTSSTNIVSYEWNFGDGNVGAGVLATNTYADAGEYTASLLITDANGLTNSVDIGISVVHFAEAVIDAVPTSGEALLEVAFDGSGSSSSSTITSYEWDFGNGTSAMGMMVTNVYGSGEYTASLVVTDSNGLSDTNTVTIIATKSVTADYIQTSETLATSEVPTFSTEDLAQTEYLSSTGTGGNESSQHAQLFNGLIGNQDGDTNDDGEVRLTSTEAITITFDTSVNENGYDISLIETLAGWTSTIYSETQTNNQSRANQGYEIRATFVDGSLGTFVEATHWEPNGEASRTDSPAVDVNDKYWTKVSFTNAVGSDAMLRNVKSLTFDVSENARANGVVIYREIDVFGVPSGVMLPTEIVISYGDDSSTLSWASDSTYSYQVQSSSTLTNPDWQTFETVLGTPPVTTVDLPVQEQNKEFYRVISE